ncbi:MAG TPA: glycosyltransferase family 4 protein [Nannocystaceae bacterium]|nr:glycosyltransferase family 4 protein [Nannocystaceae bacterium]
MELTIAIATFFGAGVVTSTLVRRLLPWLVARRILALPTARSSHARPTPCGGGLGIVAVLVPTLWIAASVDADSPWRLCALACAGLAWCSWVDDRRGVAPIVRLLAQLVAVVGVLCWLDRPIIAVLPPWLDRTIVALAWLWFTNLYNFMDGIDGLAGVETMTIGIGLALVVAVGTAPFVPAFVPAAAAGAALGFLRWNWSPARVFLGDVGSIPLGYALGFVLIVVAGSGAWYAALVLPAYFVADATTTLVRRILAGHRPWHAHRDHYYQRAVAAGRGHARVTADVARTNVALVVLALASLWIGGIVVPLAAWIVWRRIRGWRVGGRR